MNIRENIFAALIYDAQRHTRINLVFLMEHMKVVGGWWKKQEIFVNLQ